MSEKYLVPQGMLQAALDSAGVEITTRSKLKSVLEAALKWQAERGPLPTIEQCEEIYENYPTDSAQHRAHFGRICAEGWLKQMYLAPPDDFERECGDLTWTEKTKLPNYYPANHNEQIREAFRRGQRSK